MTEDELRGPLSQLGVASLAGVKRASLEGDGRISVIREDHALETSSLANVQTLEGGTSMVDLPKRLDIDSSLTARNSVGQAGSGRTETGRPTCT